MAKDKKGTTVCAVCREAFNRCLDAMTKQIDYHKERIDDLHAEHARILDQLKRLEAEDNETDGGTEE